MQISTIFGPVMTWLRGTFVQLGRPRGARTAALRQWTTELTQTNAELAREVAQRQRVEHELRQAETKYRSIFENAVEGIFQTTSDGRYLSVNPALARIYGYETPEALISSLTDIGGQLYVNASRRAEFTRLLQEHSTVSGFELQVYRRDGQVIRITETARAVRDASGGLLYYEGTVQDISARKRAEEELQKAKAVIRTQEKSIGTHIPIVALTAHAMQEDRERCLAAGMDAYLSKPLQASQLFQLIDRLVPGTVPMPETAWAIASGGTVFDQQATLARVKGDREMLQEIVRLFFAETPALLARSQTAMAHGDGRALERAAHSLKGTVMSFGAQTAGAAALRLEAMGRGGDLMQAVMACAELDREVAQLGNALAVFRGEPVT